MLLLTTARAAAALGSAGSTTAHQATDIASRRFQRVVRDIVGKKVRRGSDCLLALLMESICHRSVPSESIDAILKLRHAQAPPISSPRSA